MARETSPSWTPEEDEWLREDYPLYSNADLAAFKALDGWPRDESAIARRARHLGLRKDRSRGYVRTCRKTVWTPERVEWFRGFAPDHLWDEIRDEAKRLFGMDLTRSAVQNARNKFGTGCNIHDAGRFHKGDVPANKGRTWDEMGISAESRERMLRTTFRKGDLPHNTRALLDVRQAKGGYMEIHVGLGRMERANDQWIPLGCFNWMAANGRDWPDGCRCAHADGDVTNDDADNIVPVPSELWPLVCGANPSSLPYHDRETLEAAILSARISRRRCELQRERRIAEGRPWASDLKAVRADSSAQISKNE